jgi:hypothetical protein
MNAISRAANAVMESTMKKKITLIALLLVTLLLAACGGDMESASEADFAYDEGFYGGDDAGAAEAPMEERAAYDGEIAPVVLQNGAVATEPQSQVQDRLIIRTGWMSITVADPEATVAEIGSLANGLGGWVVSTEMNEYSSGKQGSITIRIPAGAYDDAVASLKDLAVEVKSESSSSQDVTEEYVDLNARLGNLEATRDRVATFLDEADTVEEALAVNQELSRLEGEIEVIKGRMQYLSTSAAYSTITISVTPDLPNQPIEVAGWRPQGVAKDAIETLAETLQGLANVVIWLAIYVLPMLLVIGLPIYFVVRLIRRWWRGRRVAAAPTPAPTEA